MKVSEPESFEEAMHTLVATQQELRVYGEMLAQVLNQTGPVKIPKGTQLPKGAGIDVDFKPDGEYAIISLVVPDAG